jgi:hypothetical protein
MTIGDIERLRGDAPRRTHLARYDRAHEAGVPRVLQVGCPHCGAVAGSACVAGLASLWRVQP